jgi:2-polyprenyl-3-methyl-5-hydroxy-6-metoxy-1,4-benzoquinol methylase
MDMGAGEGRNSFYLARQGWAVTAVDAGEGVVSLIKKRAQDLGANVATVVATDEQYDYGHEKWDLICPELDRSG